MNNALQFSSYALTMANCYIWARVLRILLSLVHDHHLLKECEIVRFKSSSIGIIFFSVHYTTTKLLEFSNLSLCVTFLHAVKLRRLLAYLKMKTFFVKVTTLVDIGVDIEDCFALASENKRNFVAISY